MKFTAVLAVALATASLAAPALAQNAYGTGASNPWGIGNGEPGSPETAMDTAFGAGNWTKTQGFTTAIFAGKSFVYLDGGDSVGITDFFVNGGGRAALEAFVLGGGAAFVNAARNDEYSAFDVGFGLTLTGANYSTPGTLTAAGLAAGFDGNGAGTSWSGNSFSHDVVTCSIGAACDGATSVFVTGDFGDLVAGGRFGRGYLMVGGQTAPYFHSVGGPALRANELAFVESFAAVPEPASWAMLIAGFGLTGAAMRRRRVAVA